MQNDKVISLRTRKPLEETLKEEAEQEAKVEQQLEEARKEAIKVQTDACDALRALAEKDVLGPIIIVAQVKDQDNLFYNDVIYGLDGMKPSDAIAYVGQLEMLKLEISEIAMNAPVLTSEGEVIAPQIDYEEDDFDE